MPNWELRLEDWTKSNRESLELIHLKANEAFQYTMVVSEKVSSRAFTLISIIIPVVSVILGLLSGNWFGDKNDIESIVKIAISIFCIPSVLSLGILVWMIYPKKFMHAGREPKLLAIPNYIQSEKYSKEEQYISLLIGEIQDLQLKITYNEAINNVRIIALKWVLRISSLSVLVAMGTILYHSFFMKI